MCVQPARAEGCLHATHTHTRTSAEGPANSLAVPFGIRSDSGGAPDPHSPAAVLMGLLLRGEATTNTPKISAVVEIRMFYFSRSLHWAGY